MQVWRVLLYLVLLLWLVVNVKEMNLLPLLLSWTVALVVQVLLVLLYRFVPQYKLLSVLVMGVSIVHHVTVPAGVTHCHPGALVSDISYMLPRLLDQTLSVYTIMLHVGANNIKQQQSELLKR